MSIFTVIGLGLLAMVVILRFKVPIGAAILAGGAVMWALWNPSIPSLGSAVTEMLSQSRTYDLLFALYFVMCLEIELRKSGTLRGMVDSLNEIFSSTKVTLATMPAFLGLLPSMGGARFSAPIVDEASRGMEISRESKASINFWFRHVCEFMSPIIPGMILGCAVANISVSDLVVHLAWMAVVAFLAGWFVLIRPLRFTDRRMKREHTPESRRRHIREISLAIGPVLVNVILMLVFDVSAGLAMGIVTVLMIPVLHLMKRPVDDSGSPPDEASGFGARYLRGRHGLEASRQRHLHPLLHQRAYGSGDSRRNDPCLPVDRSAHARRHCGREHGGRHPHGHEPGARRHRDADRRGDRPGGPRVR